MGLHEQPRPNEVRELVSGEAAELSEASADQSAAEEDQEAGHRELPQLNRSAEHLAVHRLP